MINRWIHSPRKWGSTGRCEDWEQNLRGNPWRRGRRTWRCRGNARYSEITVVVATTVDKRLFLTCSMSMRSSSNILGQSVNLLNLCIRWVSDFQYSSIALRNSIAIDVCNAASFDWMRRRQTESDNHDWYQSHKNCLQLPKTISIDQQKSECVQDSDEHSEKQGNSE